MGIDLPEADFWIISQAMAENRAAKNQPTSGATTKRNCGHKEILQGAAFLLEALFVVLKP